jgi:hypothetical protein
MKGNDQAAILVAAQREDCQLDVKSWALITSATTQAIKVHRHLVGVPHDFVAEVMTAVPKRPY